MEYGLIANIDQYTDNKSLEIQQVQAANQSRKTDQQNQLREIEKEEFLNPAKAEKTQKTASEATEAYHEVVLTNMNFGYNSSSQDFFVKAVRGNSENQYPTEQMMRLKAFLINSIDTGV